MQNSLTIFFNIFFQDDVSDFFIFFILNVASLGVEREPLYSYSFFFSAAGAPVDWDEIPIR